MPRVDDLPDDDAANQRVAQTLDLAQRFFDAAFADPSLLDGIPDGANVIFIPDDDEDVARANSAAAARMQAAGRLVHLVRV